jgi:hypothetical protein
MTFGQQISTLSKRFGQFANKSMVVDVVNSFGYRGEGANDGGQWFFGNNGIDLHFKYNGHQSGIDAYSKCPPVTAIINRKAQAFINGITKIENTQGKESNSIDAKKIKSLLRNPNPLQTWKQFEAQAIIYMQLFGFVIWLPIKPAGFPNIDSTAVWNIPPYMVDVKETKELFYKNPNGIISKIILTYKNVKTTINIEDIAIIEDFTPNFDSLVIPSSRIESLTMPITNIVGAYESRNVLINYRGALGILSNDSNTQMGVMPLNPSDKEAIQYDFQRYGLKKSQWQVIVTNAALKWQQMGYATKDLMLFEEIADDTMKICDAYGYPYRLLSSEKAASYNDVKEFKKELYQDTIIPEANSFYEQVNQFFHLEEFNLILKKDYSQEAVMQEDIKLMSAAYFDLAKSTQMLFLTNAITLNQIRSMMSKIGIFGTLPETSDGDKYYSDIKDLIGKATLKGGEISQVDMGDEANAENTGKSFKIIMT